MQMNHFILLAIFTNLLLLTSVSYADMLPSSNREGFISLDVEHAQSNNIRKTSNNQKSGYEQRADIGVGYQNQTATNYSALDYGIYYSHYSEPDIEDESDITGSLTINQQIFSENLQLDLSHFRRSYLLDSTGVDLPGNEGSRDVFTVSPLWRLPYSKRAGFDTRYTYTAVRLSDDGQQDTNRNALSIAWYHHFNNKMTYQLSTQYDEVDFLLYDLTYENTTVDMSLGGRLKAGSYLIKTGYSRVAVKENSKEGGIFQLSYEYRFQKHTLAMSAQRELTDSSLGLGQDTPNSGDINYDRTGLIWIDRVSLDHSFFANHSRFTNKNSLYFEQETPLLTRKAELSGGISTQLNWKHTELLTTSLRAGYKQTEVELAVIKEEWRTSISSSYRFHPKLFFTLAAEYEEQIQNEQISGYDELRLVANIRFKH
jgi:hypothetical protein